MLAAATEQHCAVHSRTKGHAELQPAPCQLLLTAHPASPRPRSLLAHHYFYQNFREVPGRSLLGYI